MVKQKIGNHPFLFKVIYEDKDVAARIANCYILQNKTISFSVLPDNTYCICIFN
jgi:hypothetical protein